MKNLWTIFFFTDGFEINHFDDILPGGDDANPSRVNKGLTAIKLDAGTNAIIRSGSTSDKSNLLNKEMVK
jgi:hypothetical protein